MNEATRDIVVHAFLSGAPVERIMENYNVRLIDVHEAVRNTWIGEQANHHADVALRHRVMKERDEARVKLILLCDVLKRLTSEVEGGPWDVSIPLKPLTEEARALLEKVR